MRLPPSFVGGVQRRFTNPFPTVPFTDRGAPGSPLGVMATEGVEGSLSPASFVATTVNVYAVLFVRPVIVQLFVSVLQVKPCGLEVTVYALIGLPPSSVDGVQLMVACALPALAVTAVGALGAAGASSGGTMIVTVGDVASRPPAVELLRVLLNTTVPVVRGVHSHVATTSLMLLSMGWSTVRVVVATAPQPGMVIPFALKLTVPLAPTYAISVIDVP